MNPWPVWIAVLVVGGWLLLAVTVGAMIGRATKTRDAQKPADPPARPPRGNVDLTTALNPVRRDEPRR